MPLILPGNVASATADAGYTVANSCRFDKGDTAYMHKTTSAGNRKTWTYSTWFKRISLGTQVTFGLVQANTANDNIMAVQLVAANTMDIWDYNGGMSAQITTNRVFRDVGSWYHVVLAVDTTDSTANNRMRLYINGVEERGAGGYSTDTMPAEDYTFNINVADKALKLGVYDYGSVSSPADFYLAETVFIDGTQYAASDFGEFDEDSPTIWKPKDVSGLTFGTNGFYLDYEASDNLGNDANGGTDLTEVNLAATDQSTDTPTNNFCTWNPLVNIGTATTYSEGNLTVSSDDAEYRVSPSTLAVGSGKWYVEFKAVSGHDATTDVAVGIVQADTNFSTASQNLSAYPNGYSYGSGGRVSNYDNSTIYTGSTYTDGDILGVVVDLDNSKLYFHKNGTYQNSGDPTSGATGTGAVSITAGKDYYIACSTITSGGTKVFSANFGSPAYANSSSVADGNGYGAFEYAVPSGYYALCTKNLAEYG